MAAGLLTVSDQVRVAASSSRQFLGQHGQTVEIASVIDRPSEIDDLGS